MSGRPGFHSARTNKGHPRRQARRDRAADRLAGHVHDPACRQNRLADPEGATEFRRYLATLNDPVPAAVGSEK